MLLLNMNKVELQNWLWLKTTTLLNIFLLEVKFDKSIVGLHFLLISSMLAKFIEN